MAAKRKRSSTSSRSSRSYRRPSFASALSAASDWVKDQAFRYAVNEAVGRVSDFIGKPVPPIDKPTQTMKRSPARSYGARSSKSAGFFTGRRKRVARKTQKRLSKRNVLGVTRVSELGGVLDSAVNNGFGTPQSATHGNTVAVGHATVPFEAVLKMACRAVIKRLLIQMGYGDLSNFEEPMKLNSLLDQLRFSYYQNATSNALSTSFIPTAQGGSALSPEQMAVYWANQISELPEEIQPYSLEWLPNDSNQNYLYPYQCIKLTGCTLSIFTKSTLKIQNRTVNSVGGDEESVDNVPVYGLFYEGKGSGTGAITKDKAGVVSAARDFVCEDKFGAIAKVPSEKWYQEPPRADQFLKVKKSGKAKLDPGEIKTSRIQDRVTIGFDSLIRALNSYQFAARNHGMHRLGSYRFFMFEKMINAVAGTAANSIKIAWEANLYMSCTAYVKRNYQTTQLNEVAQIASEA